MRNKRSRLFTWLRYLLYNLAVLCAIDYAFFRHWVGKLVARPHPIERPEQSRRSGLPIELLHSLGEFRDMPERRDLRTLRVHRPDLIRIGALGDSFTFGDEVRSGLDYPSLLQARFRRAGFDNVEVINFGNSWYGFGQVFRLWDQLAKNYGLSFILLGPGSFQTERDETFNHTEGRAPYYLHGRYILDGDGVRWLDVLGDFDTEDPFRNYYRFIPHWDYFRYDRHPPGFLQSLLPEGKSIKNPFYYSRADSEAEGLQLYERLLRRMLEDPAQVVLLHREPQIAELGRRFSDKMVAATLPQLDFPHLRAFGHYSGAGNALVADGFFQVLTGQNAIRLSQLHLADLPAVAALAPGARTLDAFSRADVRIGAARVATVVHIKTDYGLMGVPDEPVDFHALGTRSLFALAPGAGTLLDCYLVQLDFPLRSGMKAELEIAAGGETTRLGLGEVVFPSRDLSIGYVRLEAVMPSLAEDAKQVLDVTKLPPEARGINSGRVLLDGKPIFELAVRWGQVVLQPVRPSAGAYFKPGDDAAFDPTLAPPEGDVQLVLAGTPPAELTLARFSRQATLVPYARTGLHRSLRPSASDPHRAELVP